MGFTFINNSPLYASLSTTTTTSNPIAITSSPSYVSTIFFAPYSGVIDRVSFTITAISGSPGPIRVGIQQPNLTSRGPNGIWQGAGSSGYAEITTPTPGNYTLQLSGLVPVTGGSPITVSVQSYTGTHNSTNCVFIARGMGSFISRGIPYVVHGSSTVLNSVSPAPYGIYTDGRVAPLECNPASGAIAESWISSSNPLYRGNAFIPPYDARCNGVVYYTRTPDSRDWMMKVFKDGESTPLVAQYVDGTSHSSANNAMLMYYIYFPSIVLSSGTIYRFILEPVTTTNPTNHMILAYYSMHDQQLGLTISGLYGTQTHTGNPPTWTDLTGGIYGYRLHPIIPLINEVLIGYTGEFSTSNAGSRVYNI